MMGFDRGAFWAPVRGTRTNWGPFLLMLLITAMLLAVLPAAAQPVTSPEDLLAKGRTPNDYSYELFRQLLGQFWDNPFSTLMGGVGGGPASLIAAMFLVMNMGVFVIGVAWASYNMVAGVVETAESGELMGRRMSKTWLPIRMTIGFGSIVPIFGGFNLGQVIIVLFATMGIGLANFMYKGALDAAAAGLVLPNAAGVGRSGAAGEARPLIETMFRSHVCMELVAQAQRAKNSTDPSPGARTLGGGVYVGGFRYEVTGGPTACGIAAAKERFLEGRGDSSLTGFRIASVNYDAITAMYKRAHTAALEVSNGRAQVLAQQWVVSRMAALASNAPGSSVPPYPREQIDALARQYGDEMAAALASMAQAGKDAIEGRGLNTMEAMRDRGWMSAGAWTQSFMEINAAYADAANAVSLVLVEPKVDEVRRLHADAADAYDSALRTAQRHNVEEAEREARASAVVENGFLCGSLINASPTGNCSWGQALVRSTVESASVGSGGGSLINPLIAFKNLGDHFMWIGQAMGAAMAVLDLDKPDKDKGLVGYAVSKIAGNIPGGGALLDLVKQLGGVIAFLVPYIIVLGMFMAIYMPMIPFITWMGGLIQYAVVVLQGLAGASLAGLAHLDAEGEGLGNRTQAWYMLVLSVTFRPALMLLGFFLALVLMLGLATIQFELFAPAMANAQGNSVTGVLSVIGFITIFAFINWSLIQGMFNMIFIFPDQILGLVGTGNPNADLGRETEDRVHRAFVLLGGRMEGAVLPKGRSR